MLIVRGSKGTTGGEDNSIEDLLLFEETPSRSALEALIDFLLYLAFELFLNVLCVFLVNAPWFLRTLLEWRFT